MIISHDPIRRGPRVIVSRTRLELEPGSCVGVVGLNGAGKSTWLHALAGLLPGAEGAVAGDESGDMPGCHPERSEGSAFQRATGDGVALTVQHPSLPGWMTVRECLALFIPGLESVASVAARWPIDNLLPRMAGTLSKGEVQLVSVIISLECDAPLRCLDEPFSALDLARRRQVIDALVARRGRSSGVTIVTAQVASDLFEACTHILALRDGTLRMLGSTAALAPHDAPDRRAAFEQRAVAALLD